MGNINNSKYDFIFSDEEKELIVNDYVINKLSIRDICKKYDIKCKDWVSKLLKGKTRSLSEANKIAHLLKPECFKHSEETKEKIRKARLNYLKNHREDTAWRRANMSYPESQFIKYLESRKLDLKYLIEREYPVFPYYIDFAFVDIKVAIEVDGSQHLVPERKLKDDKKDALLLKSGWKVIRIAENIVKTDWDLIDSMLDKIINSDIKFCKVGIIKAPKTRQKVARDSSGLSEKLKLLHLSQRKVLNRPNKEELFELIKTTSFVKIGKMYGVSDKTIRKWCKSEGLPSTKREINLLLNI